MSIWDNLVGLEMCEAERNLRYRAYGKLQTFDCFNCHSKDDRAFCIKGHYLASAKDGSMFLPAVLQGTTSGVCLSCPDFDTE